MRWWPAVVKGQPEINLQKVRGVVGLQPAKGHKAFA